MSIFVNEAKHTSTITPEEETIKPSVYAKARFGKQRYGRGQAGSGQVWAKETKNSSTITNETKNSATFTNEKEYNPPARADYAKADRSRADKGKAGEGQKWTNETKH